MDKLLKLLQNNKGRGVRINARAEGDEATIYIYDVIGYNFFSDSGVVAVDLVKEITGLKAKTIHLRINSPGGDFFDARAIHTALVHHPAKIISHIDGVAASGASIIALAGDEIEIAEGGFFMIHNAMGMAIGNSEDMIEMAALLEKVDGTLVTDYQKKSGQEEKQVKAWMAAETWFTAQEALEAGFVDSIYEGEKVENKFDLSAFVNTPETLKAEPDKVTDDMVFAGLSSNNFPTEELSEDINLHNGIASNEESEASESVAKEESDENLIDESRGKRERKLAQVKRGI